MMIGPMFGYAYVLSRHHCHQRVSQRIPMYRPSQSIYTECLYIVSEKFKIIAKSIR